METQSPYIVDGATHRMAAQLGMNAFGRMEEVSGEYVIAEDYVLARCMADGDDDEILSLAQAREYYAALEKAE